MNTQEYIDSGILELYVAGGLTEAEQADVERTVAQYPAVQIALEEVTRAIEAYALTHAKAPRPELEEKILANIRQLFSESGNTASANETKVIPLLGRHQKNSWQWVQIAAAMLLAISAATNIYLYQNLNDTQQELLTAQKATRQYAVQVNQIEQRAFRSENLLSVLRDPKTQVIQLKGVEAHPEAQAAVYWNQDTKEVFFDPGVLPTAPAGKQYQLWALADGKPIDAGLVSLADNPLQRMKTISEAQAFALTLEPEGGSASPTLHEMLVMGNI